MMDITAEERRRVFSVWLRTGRLPAIRNAVGVEFKFNPWHDAESGRFTFVGTGRYFGGSGQPSTSNGERSSGGSRRFRGGRGSFGGGGATEGWTSPAPRREVHEPVRRLVSPRRGTVGAPVEREIARRQFDAQSDWRRVVRNGYEYQIDTHQRTRRVSGTLTLNGDQRRSRMVQAQAGGRDRRSSDDGGHYIARRFNGPTEAFNHFAQDANFNRGRYRSLEDEWAREKRAGKRVTVKIVPVYNDRSQRPSAINVWFWIDGNGKSLKFSNGLQEASRADR